ncbi:MAG: hypothetical protein AB9866_28940 [Syntrophobacteraceae bacterium]
MSKNLVAIAPFLISTPKVTTLGIRASMGDYSRRERDMLLAADRILFPTRRFVGIFEAAGKECFPNGLTYRVRHSRIVQETLLRFFGSPHPRTRIYFGRQKRAITDHFSFPFLAMGPDAAAGVRLVANVHELQQVSRNYNPLIVQDAAEYGHRFRMIFANFQCAGIVEGGGGNVGQVEIPPVPLDKGEGAWGKFAAEVGNFLRSANLNDIAVTVGSGSHGLEIISLSRPPLCWQSPYGKVNRHEYISRLIANDEL